MPSARTSFANILFAISLLLGLALPAAAQSAADETQALNAALSHLARNPLDPGALMAAGDAALAIGDAEAAAGFFTRAQEVAPGNARAKAGLASAYVRKEDPFTAIRLFAEVERAGALSSTSLADRGLAYDLVGDNVTAQRFYRMAGPANDEALRRLALSLAIAGDKRGSEAALAPLLARKDRTAWRVRAFSLAIVGETAQAVSISNAMLPTGLATAITPYLRYMGQLTRAQQAAAANFGHFPRASEIGRDDPRIAQYSRPSARPATRGADAGLIPSGEPLGNRSAQRAARQQREVQTARSRDRQASRERERPPEPVVATSTRVAAAAPAPVQARSAPAPAAQPALPTAPRGAPAAAPQVALAAPVLAPPQPAAPQAVVAQSRPVQGPSFELVPAAQPAPIAQAAPIAPPATAAPPSPTAEPAVGPPAPASLADAFSEFNRPTISTTPAPGAVDVRKIAAARVAPPKAKPAPPAHPSRVWVQVATGRDKKALAFDWRKMSRENAAMFKGRKPYVTAWNQTNRMLTGPFASEAAATEFMNRLRKEDVAGAFLWTSPAGQVVDELAGAK